MLSHYLFSFVKKLNLQGHLFELFCKLICQVHNALVQYTEKIAQNFIDNICFSECYQYQMF